MRIVAIIDSLHGGGAERIFVSLVKDWLTTGHQVTIITFKSTPEPPLTHEKLKIVSLFEQAPVGITKVLSLPLMMVRVRRQIQLTAPDLIVSFMDQANIISLLATIRLSIPIVISERVYPAYSSLLTGKIPLLRCFFDKLRNICYKRATRIVLQSDRSISYFPFPLHQKIIVIPNPIIAPTAHGIPVEISTPTILALGRLSAQKRFDLVIKAFQLVAADFPEWHLLIVGSGTEYDTLQQLADTSSATSQIHFLGYQGNTAALFAQASVFVLASDYEGFPVALGEALYSGIPVIATDCLTGPREMIGDNQFGVLVPTNDPQTMGAAMKKLMSNLHERARLSALGKARAVEFESSKIFPLWQQMFEEISNKNS